MVKKLNVLMSYYCAWGDFMNNETLVYFIKDSLDGFKLLCGYFFDLVYIGSCGVIGAFLASFGPILYFVLVENMLLIQKVVK